MRLCTCSLFYVLSLLNTFTIKQINYPSHSLFFPANPAVGEKSSVALIARALIHSLARCIRVTKLDKSETNRKDNREREREVESGSATATDIKRKPFRSRVRFYFNLKSHTRGTKREQTIQCFVQYTKINIDLKLQKSTLNWNIFAKISHKFVHSLNTFAINQCIHVEYLAKR